MPIRLFAPAAACAAALGVAVPALASTDGAARPYARASIPTKKSTGFAGYQIHGKNGMTGVTTTIVVPKLKCSKTNRAIGASAGLYQDSTSNRFSAALFIGCVRGKATYYPFLTVKGHRQSYPKTVAHPGDMVTLQVDANTTETVVEVDDLTHSFSKSKTSGGYKSFVANPWVGDVAWRTKSGTQGVPSFGKIHFRTATLNGTPFGSLKPHQVRFNRYNSSKTTLQIQTGGYGPSMQAFGTTFKHS